MGMSELIVIFVIIFLFAFPIWLCLFLRKRHPGRLWLGLLLCLLNPVIGQLYVPGAALWIIILLVVAAVLGGVLKAVAGGVLIPLLILSWIIMYFRIRKLKGEEIPETVDA